MFANLYFKLLWEIFFYLIKIKGKTMNSSLLKQLSTLARSVTKVSSSPPHLVIKNLSKDTNNLFFDLTCSIFYITKTLPEQLLLVKQIDWNSWYWFCNFENFHLFCCSYRSIDNGIDLNFYATIIMTFLSI